MKRFLSLFIAVLIPFFLFAQEQSSVETEKVHEIYIGVGTFYESSPFGSVYLGYSQDITKLISFGGELGLAYIDGVSAFSALAQARFNWYRGEKIRLYSTLKVGLCYAERLLPMGNFMPFGMEFGRKCARFFFEPIGIGPCGLTSLGMRFKF